MQEFFDKLGAAARRAAGTVVNEVSVAAEKQKLADAYRDLGKHYYQSVRQGKAADLTQEMNRIDEILRNLENLKDRRNVTDVGSGPDDQDFVTVEE